MGVEVMDIRIFIAMAALVMAAVLWLLVLLERIIL
jgi:hypothetical protein